MRAKTEKWFRRNCNDVIGRECSRAEKADMIELAEDAQALSIAMSPLHSGVPRMTADSPFAIRRVGVRIAALVGTQAWADAATAGSVPLLPKYQQECAACHVAYPPGMLPADSWQRL